MILFFGLISAIQGGDMTETATFGGGCFWGVEEHFRTLDGVESTAVGYMGGHTENPSYREVCTDKTGHAEVVRVIYNPGKITYRELLHEFFSIHNPTQLNRQGPDRGTQYRSVIFFYSNDQKKDALQVIQTLEKSGKYSKKIMTDVKPASVFYPAEDYHQKYLFKRGLQNCEL